VSDLPTITLGDSGEGGEPAYRPWVAAADGTQICYVDELGPAAFEAAETIRQAVAAYLAQT
jgi:hypothetical protein